MRKVLGSLSLLVLLFNALVTPITYAWEYEEILETSSDNVTEEVVEENGEEDKAPEFSVEEESWDEENEEEKTEEEETETEKTEELEGLEWTEWTEWTEENNDTENNEDEETTNLQESQTWEETQEQTDPSDDTTVETTEIDDNASEDTEEDGEEWIFTPITNAIEDFFNKDNFTKFSIKSEEQNDKSLDVEETFTVTFDANRWTFADLPSPNPQTVSSWSLITNLPSADPELNWYTFTGWFTDPKGGREWNFENDVVTEDITLYAHWTYNYDFWDLDVYIVDTNGDVSKYVMMDRNVWASDIYNQNFSSQNTGSFGYVYQWWNNWWFERCRGNWTTCHWNNTVNPLTSSALVPKTTWEKYMPSKYTSKIYGTNNANNTASTWQANGTTTDNLRWFLGGNEEKQWPCPDWYYVPLKSEFNEVVVWWNDAYKIKSYDIFKDYGFQDTQITDFTHDFLFPLAWNHRKWLLTDTEQWGCAEYATSSPSSDKTTLNIFFCKKGENSYYDGNSWKKKYWPDNSTARTNWSTVRCFKNTDTANLNIYPDKWTGAVITVDKVDGTNTIIALTEPTRTQAGLGGLHFDWWYTDPNFDPSTRKEEKNTASPQPDSTVYTLSAQETSLYAKWSCPQEGYEYNGISCVQRHTITFNASGGTFNVGGIPQTTTTESLLYGLTYNYSDLPTPTRTWFIFKGWYTGFDGIDDYVDYGREYMFTDQISFHASAYMDTWDTGKRIVSSMHDGWWALNGWLNWLIKVTAYKGNNSSDAILAESTTRWADLPSKWHDFDFVFDGELLKLYLDWNLIAESTGSFPNWKIVYNPNNITLVGAEVWPSTIPEDPWFYFEWMIKDVIFSHSDQIITSTNALSVPNQDVTYYALWEGNDWSYEVEVTIDPSTWWNVTWIGLYAEGAEITLTATPNTWYQFTWWYDESDNLISHNNPYVFTADASDWTWLKAVFELKQYTVSAESNDINKGTILFPIGPYTHWMSIQFSPTVTNPLLYKFLKWTLNGNEVLTWNNKYLTWNLVVELTWNVNVVGFFTWYDTCSFNNQIIQHGGTVTWYQSATVPYNEECAYEIRTCNDGTLDGNYQYASCSKQGPASCQLPWWGELAHWQSVTWYKASSVTCPNSCESQQATCNNGSWDVENFVTNYKSSTCTYSEYSCGEGFTLDSCPAHGTCSEPCTPNTVNENACVPWTQKVKLIKCDEWYQVDNNECTANEYAVIFDANWGNWTMAQDTATYGTNYTIKNSNFTKEWSTFSWWNTKADKSWIRYYSWETILWSLTGDLTLYAQWKLNTYTVTYNAQAHSWTINSQPTSWEYVEYDIVITLPTKNVVSLKSWYNFIWWTTTLGWTEPISNTYTVREDVTFYPIFKKEKVEKNITFHVNYNSWYVYSWVKYTTDRLFSGCTIPTLYNIDPYTWSCSVHITLPDIIAHENTPTVLWWSTGENERTIKYSTWAGITITIPENKNVELYAQTKSEVKTYEATYGIDRRVEATLPWTPVSCTIQETFNGVQQKTSCEDDLITLPAIVAKTGYHSPVWKLWETEYASWTQIALSWNVILTGTATPDEHTPYIVKHYYQTLTNTGVYELSWEDNLSWATESILTLSELQKEASSIPWFTYWNSRVNNESATTIDVTTIQDFTYQAEIQSWLVIQLFYTRKNNPVTLHQIGNAIVEKIPSKDSYYYGETITFSGYADEWYTFSWWDIREWGAETWRREWNNIEYTMISTWVEVTPVIREHRYTIHYNASGAVGTMEDETVNYSEEVTLPTSGEVATHFTYTWHHFVWWTTWIAETTVITTLTKATPDDNGEITLYAKWEENDWVSYSVEYYLEPIEEWRPQSEYVLQTADTYHGTAPQWTTVTWTVKNYPWFTSPEAEAWTAESEGSLVIRYYYTRNSYDYTFAAWEWAEFSDWATSKTVSFRYEQSVALPGWMTLIKTGFTFSNWNPVLGPMSSEAKTSTAEWTENQYTINYNANGWAWTTPSQTVRYTEKVALTWNAFTKEWYVFTWWSKTTDWAVEYKDKALVSKLEATNNATVTLYAQWSAEKYVVTFDANSWDVAYLTKEVTYDATYGELPTPNRTGYTFQWWYTAKEWWTKVISSTQVKTANDHTLYAHWTENHYTIAFNANGWEWTMASITNIPYSENRTLTENVFTRNGYRFVWWARTSISTVKEFNDKAIVKELTGENNAIVILYALWSKWSYKIDYVLNGWALTWGKTNLTGYDVDTATFILNNPERDGYKFIWWSGTAIDWLSWTVTIAQWSTWDRVYEANWEVKTYTINYELNTWALPAGQTNPGTYTIESEDITLINPIRTGYDFNWWSGTAIEWTGNTVTITHWSTWDRKYEANWKIKTYTITWKNSTWTVLKEETLPYWATPDYGGTPTSWEDAQYTYTFKWWEPEIASVTEDQVYTATYNQTINTYTITFKNEDWTELYTTWVAYWTTPVYSWAEPTKENTAQYTYTFNWWTPTLAPVTWEATYTATYTGTINKYTITFVDEDGRELKAWEEYEYWTASWAIVQPDEPAKAPTPQTGYTFAWWTPTLTGVTKDQVYTATYSQTTNSYPITFYDEDWVTKIKWPTLYPYWTETWVIVPVGTPTKDSDGTYTYEFDKWTPDLETVVWTADYTATYKSTYIDYLVTFLDSTWAVLTSGYYHSWETVTIPTWPAKASTAQTGYTFKSWYPEVQVVTWDITYEPTYTETTRSYTITWLSSTWETLRTDTLLYGSTPNYGENPTSWSTAEYEYTFKSWEPSIQTVTEDAIYTATYDSTKRKYPITWKNEDWTEIWVTDVEYGVVPAAPSIPSKDFTEQTWYVFNWWNPSPVAVTEAATYTATYAEYTREYTILWKDYDGEVIKTWENIPYGTLIVTNKPTTDPNREATAQTGYTFTGWYDEAGIKLTNTKKLTWDISYTARYDGELRTYTIIWNNRNGAELEKDENVPYWTIPSYDSAEPTSWADIQYTYHFSWWTPLTWEVTGDQVYIATYTHTTNSYPITWKDEDGTGIETIEVPYWVTPSYTWPELTKEWHSFDKWTPDLEPVVWTASYTASYIINSYNITPVKWVWVANILWWWSYPYNSTVTLTWIAKEWYHFSWWVSEKAFTYTVPSHNITPQIDAEPNTYHVHFKPNGWTWVMANQEFVYDVEQELSPNAYTRSWFTFISWTDWEWWYYTDKKKVKNLATTWSVILLAQWFEWDGPTPWPTPTPSWWWSSWWGWRRSIDKDTQEHASAAESWDIKEVEDKTQTQTWTTAQTWATKTWTTIQWTEEELTAYQYAYKYWITTLAPKEAARPDEYVQRWHMAKMVVNYALNVLHRKLPAKMPKQCKWKDGRNAWESEEIKGYAEKACALWLMWIDMEYFQPYKLVTRAQFWTIFGRLLWWKIPATPYYAGHLARLKEEWIMTQIENPEERIEIRKWAWLMFMRSEKYFKIDK